MTRSLNLTSKILATNVWHSLDFKKCTYRNIRCSQGSVCDGVEALCLLLCVFHISIATWYLFTKPVPVISMIRNKVLNYTYATRGHRIPQWNYQQVTPPIM